MSTKMGLVRAVAGMWPSASALHFGQIAAEVAHDDDDVGVLLQRQFDLAIDLHISRCGKCPDAVRESSCAEDEFAVDQHEEPVQIDPIRTLRLHFQRDFLRGRGEILARR